MQITIGDLGAVTGVLIYRPEFSKHLYRKPHIISIGYVTFSIVIASLLWWWMAKENRRRDIIVAEAPEGKVEDVDIEEKIRLGDRHLLWRYQV